MSTKRHDAPQVRPENGPGTIGGEACEAPKLHELQYVFPAFAGNTQRHDVGHCTLVVLCPFDVYDDQS
jgi:hypothetical protein